MQKFNFSHDFSWGEGLGGTWVRALSLRTRGRPFSIISTMGDPRETFLHKAPERLLTALFYKHFGLD